jgi:phosphoheptose isomerase
MKPKDHRFQNETPEAASIVEYLGAYVETLHDAIAQVSANELAKAFALLTNTIKSKSRIFVGGNGGSAALADHLGCDWVKYDAGTPPLRVHSLVASTAVLTALANDFSYEDSLAKQIEMLGEADDVAVLISASGNSPNIVAAATMASKKQMTVLGLCGFGGGKLKERADICLHVPCNNYGIVEDAHQMLMHVLAQFLAKVRDKA